MNTERITIPHAEVGAKSRNNSKAHGLWMSLTRNYRVTTSDRTSLMSETQTSLGKRRRGSDEEDARLSPTEQAEE